MKKMWNRTLYLCLIPLLMGGCANKFKSPVVEVPEQYMYSAPYDTTEVIVNIEWWKVFGDSTLNALIDHALKNNYNVATALSRIEEAKLQMGVDRASYLPGFSFGVSGEGDYTRPTKIEQEYVIKPMVSWEISLFGALKNTSRAARADILAQEYSFAGVMLSLASQVATTYFSLIQNRQSLEVSRQTYDLRRRSAAIIDSMVRHGMSTAVDLEQAQGLTATAAAAIPQYEMAVAKTQNSLCILLGENPQYIASAMEFGESYNTLPDYVPAGLPSELLVRRPDVMQSYAQLMAASAQIGIAQAARFPSITLTADGGILSTTVKDIASGNPYPLAWNALLSITQPIFQFGKLRRNQKIAEEQFKQAEFSYRQTVISAFGDVENAIVSIEKLREQARKYRELVISNAKIQRMTSELYKEGLTDYLNVLDAERTLYSSQIEYSTLLQQQFSAYVSLYKALGGGW